MSSTDATPFETRTRIDDDLAGQDVGDGIEYDPTQFLPELARITNPVERFHAISAHQDWAKGTYLGLVADARAAAATEFFELHGGDARTGAQSAAARVLGIDRSQMHAMKKRTQKRRADAKAGKGDELDEFLSSKQAADAA